MTSWDEAWYGSIARDIVRSGDIFHMRWDSKPYYDHPPMGFWLIAVSYKLLGINEFSTRLPSALLGLLTMVLMYEVGELLFKRKVIGFGAALILGTSVWYLIRVRSGNLDAIFVFFYILTVYCSIKASKNIRWLPAASAAFAALFMTKTLVGLSALPLIIFLTFGQFLRIRNNWPYIVGGFALFFLIVFPWYYIHYKTYPNFLQHHFLNIGARNKTFSSYFHLQLEQPLFYLHMGVRKWFYLWQLSLGILTAIIGWRVFIAAYGKNILPLKRSDTIAIIFILLWNLIILYPFLTAKETQLWHLIPVYVPLAFIVAAGLYKISPLGAPLFLLVIATVAALQINTFYREVIPVNKFTPDDVAISQAAGKYSQKIYLDDDFVPIAVFYSGKTIYPLFDITSFGGTEDQKTLVGLFKSDAKDFIVVTRSWAVDNLKVAGIPYKLLEKNNSFSILAR